MRRRDTTRVIHDILLLVGDGVAKTHIVYRANLNFRLVNSYLNFLVTKGYISKQESPRSLSDLYGLTEQGKQLLGELQRLETRLEGLFNGKPKGKWSPSNIRCNEVGSTPDAGQS